ncbi:glycosyltransferase family 2 protein [Acinetobacter sp. ANC 5383]
MNQTKITVVIPVYNTAPYLEKCLNSVVNQTYRNLQIIVVNDGSMDNSKAICQRFADMDTRIEFIDKYNEGVSVARNIGIERAKGEWIYFLDSDDFVEFDALESLINVAHDYQADIIQFGIRSLKEGKLVREKEPAKFQVYEDLRTFITNNEMKPLSACLHLINIKNIRENNIIFNKNLSHGEDMLFMYTVYCYAKKIATVNKIFYNQVLSSESATRQPIKLKVMFDLLLLIDEICKQVRNLGLINEFYEEVNDLSKRIFILPLVIADQQEYKKAKPKIQKLYRKICLENKDILNKHFLKIGKINIGFVAGVIKINHKIRGIKTA